jgi:hypothetical protein
LWAKYNAPSANFLKSEIFPILDKYHAERTKLVEKAREEKERVKAERDLLKEKENKKRKSSKAETKTETQESHSDPPCPKIPLKSGQPPRTGPPQRRRMRPLTEKQIQKQKRLNLKQAQKEFTNSIRNQILEAEKQEREREAAIKYEEIMKFTGGHGLKPIFPSSSHIVLPIRFLAPIKVLVSDQGQTKTILLPHISYPNLNFSTLQSYPMDAAQVQAQNQQQGSKEDGSPAAPENSQSQGLGENPSVGAGVNQDHNYAARIQDSRSHYFIGCDTTAQSGSSAVTPQQ